MDGLLESDRYSGGPKTSSSPSELARVTSYEVFLSSLLPSMLSSTSSLRGVSGRGVIFQLPSSTEEEEGLPDGEVEASVWGIPRCVSTIEELELL